MRSCQPIFWLCLPLAVALVIAQPTLAQTPEAQPAPGAEKTDTRPNPIAQLLSSYFQIPLSEVQQLRGTGEAGLGYGAIAKLYFMAQATGRSPGEILALKQSGKGWGEIAKELGLHPAAKGNLGSIKRAHKGRGKGRQGLPPGQAKQRGLANDGFVPPGHAKKDDPSKAFTPPGLGKAKPGKGKGRNKHRQSDETEDAALEQP